MVSRHTERSQQAMTSTQSTPPAAVFVAIDVAKLRNGVMIEILMPGAAG
jgi:hypothetical protein